MLTFPPGPARAVADSELLGPELAAWKGAEDLSSHSGGGVGLPMNELPVMLPWGC